MTDVFDLWETKLCFLRVDSDILSAKALEYSSDVTEEPRFGFAVYEYIIDVYFAYFVYKSVGNGSCRRKIPSHKLTGEDPSVVWLDGKGAEDSTVGFGDNN